MYAFNKNLNFYSLDVPEKSKVPPASGPQWPDVEDIRKLRFDLNPRDHKFRHASPVYTERKPKTPNGTSVFLLIVQMGLLLCAYVFVFCAWTTGVKIEKLETEEETPKRNTVSVRLSMFAAHNAFHHCEQCHQYSEPAPVTQVRTSVDHTYMQ